MHIGQRIKERRKALKMSADEMGARLGKDRSTIYRYENGDIENLPLDILEPIAEVLQTTPQYLMGWQEVQKNNDALTDIVVRMRKDSEFFSVVEELHQLSPEQLASIKPILAVLQKG
jgi:transcriptional regulator with XRE-family HTH domain